MTTKPFWKSACALSLLLWLAACGKTDAPENPTPTPAAAQPVAITQLQQQVWPQVVVSNGLVAAKNVVDISAETGGLRIAALHADVGQTVERGQLLAELATDTLKVDLARQQALVAQAQAQLAQAEANAKRSRALAQSGAMAAETILQYQVAEQTAKAQLAVAKADIAATELKLKQAQIRAWEAGVIAARPAQLGQVVAVGTPLFQLYQDGALEWRAEVTARQAVQLQLGQRAELAVTGSDRIEAVLSKMDTAIDNDTGRLTVYAELQPRSNARAGLFASGVIITGEAPAKTIAESALLLRDGRSYLLEVSADHKLIRRAVETGRRRDGQVEILTPLPDGAKFVAEGVAFLSEGVSVTVVGSAP